MKRYWISFVSGNYADERCTAPPFQFWETGTMDRRDHLPQAFESGSEKDDLTLCALVEAEGERQIWEAVKKHFPDYEERFCNEVEHDYEPGERFPDFKNRVSLK